MSGSFELTPGRATAEGTRRFAARFAGLPGHFRAPDRLALSSLGFGTRGEGLDPADDFQYRSAVPRALEGGINVFDTALSFRLQQSERSLGAALGRAFAEGRAARDEVCVVSKGGYLTVDPDRVTSRADAQRYLYDTYVRRGLVDPERLVNGSHSLDRAFLRDGIERSRRNLGLDTIDIYCIQDPELQLVAHGATAFRRQLADALDALEEAVAKGWIGAYGIASWSGLLVPHLERGHLSLAELFELALEVGGPDHHLRAVQMPYSVAMSEALGYPSQLGPSVAVAAAFDVLRDTGTAVFAAAPLVRGRAVRGLPEFLHRAFPGLTDAQVALQFVRSTPGVTTALVGMRRLDHVDENLELCSVPPAGAGVIEALFERARREAGSG